MAQEHYGDPEYVARCLRLPQPTPLDAVQAQLELVRQLRLGIEHVLDRLPNAERLAGSALTLAMTAPIAAAGQIDRLRAEVNAQRDMDPLVRRAWNDYLWQLSDRLRTRSEDVGRLIQLRQRQTSIFRRLTTATRRMFGIQHERDVDVDEWHTPEECT